MNRVKKIWHIGAEMALIFFLSGLIFLSVLLALLQTDFGKAKFQKAIVRIAAENNIALHIGKIEGRLPLRLKIVDATAQLPDQTHIHAGYVKVRIGFFSLLKGQVSMRSIKLLKLTLSPKNGPSSPVITVKGRGKFFFNLSRFRLNAHACVEADPTTFVELAVHSTKKGKMAGSVVCEMEPLGYLNPYLPFELNGRGTLALKFKGRLKGPYTLEHLSLKTPFVNLEGDLRFSLLPTMEWAALRVQIGGAVPIEGRVNVTGDHLECQATAPPFSIEDQSFSGGSLSIVARGKNAEWNGEAHANLDSSSLPLSLKSSIQLTGWKEVKLKELYILAPKTEIGGHLSFEIPFSHLGGSLFAQTKELGHFRRLFRGSHLKGSLGAEVTFEPTSSQKGSIHAALNNFQYKFIRGDVLDFTFEGVDLMSEPKGIGAVEGKSLVFDHIHVENFYIKTFSQNQNWPFDLKATGNYHDRFEIKARGSFAKEQIELTNFEGSYNQIPLQLEEAVSLHWNDSKKTLTDCKITYPGGYFFTQFTFSKDASTASLHAEHFPLRLIWLPSSNLNFNGYASLDGTFNAAKGKAAGHLNALLEQAHLLPFGRKTPTLAKGSLQANLEQNILQIHTNFLSSNEQFFIASASLPLEVKTTEPWECSIEKSKPITGQCIFEGNIEDLFDFIDLSSQEFTGHVSSKLFLSNTLASPRLSGTLEWKGGGYENYHLGTSFQKINAHVTATKEAVILDDLTALGPDEGTFSLSGSLQLDSQKRFPYYFDAQAAHVRGIDFDTMTAHLSGPLIFEGNRDYLSISGKLTASSADLKIPDRMPLDIPELDIAFVNPPSHIAEMPLPVQAFPVLYDIKIKGEQQISLRGRGLNSHWKGKTHIKGKGAHFTTDGNLSLLKGEFVFSGQTFVLTQGEISFSEEGTQINLSGNLALPDVTITAVLKGPLTSPALTFQSIPYLPTSSILSRVIFNKDISEITPFQAIQLANTIVSLSGDSSQNLLEKIRASLGVDRFNIVSSSTSPDQIAVQIGKYLLQGVMITFSQSASSSQIIVEVELKNGFIFQAETQEDEEGKFSLKWNHNY